jgi:hypothetical protein
MISRSLPLKLGQKVYEPFALREMGCLQLGERCQKHRWRRVQLSGSLKKASFARRRSAKIVLHDSTMSLRWFADDDISKPNIYILVGYSAANPDHETEADRRETRQQLRSDDCGRRRPVNSAWQAWDHDIVLSDSPKDIGIAVTGQDRKVWMAFVEESLGCCHFYWQGGDPSHRVVFVG